MKKLFGNLLLFSALALLIYTYLPYLLSFFPTPKYQIPDTKYYIEIPKIHAVAPVVENVDPWNAAEYGQALKMGVAQAKNMPNFYFAHSSLPPWEMTRTNTAFLRLGQLEAGDEIIIVKDGVIQKYMVSGKKEVWPSQVEVLKDHPDEIILQTCTPAGTDWKRLLVFAVKIS